MDHLKLFLKVKSEYFCPGLRMFHLFCNQSDPFLGEKINYKTKT